MWDQILNDIAGDVPVPDETLVNEDGLRICAKCRKPIESRHWHPLKNTYVVLPIICDCGKKAIADAEERMKRDAIEHTRDICFGNSASKYCTFDRDDQADSRISIAMRRYAENFSTMLVKGQGLFLYGNPGSGKSFYAACIANAVIDQGYTAMMTDFGSISARIQASFDGRAEILNEVKRHSLLVLDDYGIERNTSFMDEIVYSVINARMQSGKPMIVTSNLESIKAQDVKEERVLSRLRQMCYPIKVSGVDRRAIQSAEARNGMKNLLGV